MLSGLSFLCRFENNKCSPISLLTILISKGFSLNTSVCQTSNIHQTLKFKLDHPLCLRMYIFIVFFFVKYSNAKFVSSNSEVSTLMPCECSPSEIFFRAKTFRYWIINLTTGTIRRCERTFNSWIFSTHRTKRNATRPSPSRITGYSSSAVAISRMPSRPSVYLFAVENCLSERYVLASSSGTLIDIWRMALITAQKSEIITNASLRTVCAKLHLTNDLITIYFLKHLSLSLLHYSPSRVKRIPFSAR